ncbi:MAG: hypothetical protein CM15mP46_1210 [Alphaproteobacteria bacterium]|nr:MAG: hypothetical protein CM15mP46_1210 [Alphaproteobacteria bacterium]
MSAVTVKFQRHADDVVLPDYATPGAAGYGDIAAHLDTAVTLAPFARAPLLPVFHAITVWL